jgi:hypothetical protein
MRIPGSKAVSREPQAVGTSAGNCQLQHGHWKLAPSGAGKPVNFLTHKHTVLAANRDRIERFLKEATEV